MATVGNMKWPKGIFFWAPFDRSNNLTQIIIRCVFALIRCAIMTAIVVQGLSILPGFNINSPYYYVPMWVFMVLFEEMSRYSVIRYSSYPYKAASVYLALFLVIESIGYIPAISGDALTLKYILTRLPSIVLHITVSYGMAHFAVTRADKAIFFAIAATIIHLIMNVMAWAWSL